MLPLSSSLLLLYLFVCPLGSSFVSCVVWHWHTYHASDPDLLALSYLSFSFCVGCCCCTAVLLTMYAYKSEEACARTNLLGYMEDTVWFWNDWREVEFRSGGKFFAPDADNCHDGTTCTWHVTDSGRKVVIRWGTAGEHTVSPVSASALSGAGGFLALPRVGTCNCFNTCSCKDWACCCQCNDCKNDPAVAPHCQ